MSLSSLGIYTVSQTVWFSLKIHSNSTSQWGSHGVSGVGTDLISALIMGPDLSRTPPWLAQGWTSQVGFHGNRHWGLHADLVARAPRNNVTDGGKPNGTEGKIDLLCSCNKGFTWSLSAALELECLFRDVWIEAGLGFRTHVLISH